MRESWNRFGIWQKIGGIGAIASIFGGLYLLIIWTNPIIQWLISLMGSFWLHITSGMTIPYWLLYFLIGLVLYLTIKVLGNWARNLPPPENKPHGQQYIKDVFFNIPWRWQYYAGEIDNFVAYCPQCDLALRVDETYRRIDLYCENCERGYHIDKGYDQALDYMSREIRRRFRTGEWKDRI